MRGDLEGVRAVPGFSHLLLSPQTGASGDPRGAQEITNGLEEQPRKSQDAKLS